MKNTHGEVSLLVKLQAKVCNFTKNSTPPWVFLTLCKLYKWYQSIPNGTRKASHIKDYDLRLTLTGKNLS